MNDKTKWENAHFGHDAHPVDGIMSKPAAAQEAGYIEFLDAQNHSLRRAIHAIMKKLAFLLDEDQFADIDAIALAAGVTPAAPGVDVAFRELVKACNRLNDEAEEFDGDEGLWYAAHHDEWDSFREKLDAAQELIDASPKGVHCDTCNDNGMIGGPSFYAPDEGGEPCPDCSPKGVVFHNCGDSEANFIADGERLNCPSCGGSGHVDDVIEGGIDSARLDSGVIRLPHRDEFGEDGHILYTGVNLRAAIDAAMQSMATSAEVGA